MERERARAPRDTHHREIISREMRDEGNRTTSSAPLARPPGRECSRIFNRTNRSRSTCALGAVAAIPAMLLQRGLLHDVMKRRGRHARGNNFVVSRPRSIREVTENSSAIFHFARVDSRVLILTAASESGHDEKLEEKKTTSRVSYISFSACSL